MSESGHAPPPAAESERRAALAFLGFEPAARAGAPWPASPGPGDRVGDFVIESEIGRGGMGVVFHARQVPLGRRVALKLVPERPEDDGAGARSERLEREARILASLRHEGIVAVHAAGAVRGHRYVAMDFVEGRTLRDVISGSAGAGTPSPRDGAWLRFSIEILQRIASALGAAHAHGVVHRDVKPENVILDARLRPVLVDFGLAREGDPGTLTRTQGFVGTPRYASPEQARGEPLGPASDVFSLGVVAYELLCGAPAFRGATSARLLDAIQFEDVAWPEAPRLPRDVRAVVEKCLEKRAADRYVDAREAEADLARILRYEPVDAVARGRLARCVRRARLRPARSAAVAAFVVLAATAAGSFVLLGHESATVRRVAAAARLEEARRLFVLGDLEREERILEEVAAASDPPAGARGLLADRRLRRGDAASALELYRREIAAHGGAPADRIGAAVAASEARGESVPPPVPASESGAARTARDHAAAGLLLARRREFAAAAEAYSRAVALEPSAFLWHFERGRIHLRARRFSLASADLGLVRDRPSFDRATLRNWGWSLHARARYDEHEALLRGALAAAPDDALLHADLSLVLRQLGRPEESAAALRRAVALAPDEPFVAAVAGAQLIYDQRFDAAIAHLESALERFPGHEAIAYHRALALKEAGRLAEAEAIARPIAADEAARYGVEALSIVAKAEETNGRIASAEASYALLRARDPENPRWATQHGHMLLRLEREEEAEAAFREAVALDPLRPDSLYGWGQVLRRTGRPWEAVLVYDRALALEPNRGETHYWLAHLWMELGVPGAASRYVALATAQHPTWFDAWALRGAIEAAAGSLAAAETAYRRALELRPGHAHVTADFAEVLDRLGRDREALAEYGKARATDPLLPLAWCGEGLLRLESDDPAVRDPAEAVRLLERAVELRPDDAEYRAYLERARAR